MRVLFRTAPEAPLEHYRCRLSGRIDFDLTEAAHKARRLVRDGYALLALVLDEETVMAEWRRQGTETVQVSGPDL
jgi:hypothetical protein